MTSGAIARRTPNVGLQELNFNFPNWGDAHNTNMRLIDALFRLVGAAVGQPWQNARLYLIGEIALDVDSNTVWRVEVEHTSTLLGTFEEERAAQPTYWSQSTRTFHSSVPWEPETAYPGNIFIIDDARIGYSIAEFTSSSTSFDDDVINENIVLMLDLSTYIGPIEQAVIDAENARDASQGYANASQGYSVTASTQAGIATAAKGNAESAAITATAQAGIATTKANDADGFAFAAAASASTATIQAGTATTKANEAAGSASTASTKATEASTSATNANTAKVNAETARDKASEWSDKAEDVSVETGRYSAYHWAMKSKDSADSASSAVSDAVDDAEDARDAAVIAKGASEDARDASVIAKGQAEAAQSAANSAKTAAENAKGAAESARDTAQGYASSASGSASAASSSAINSGTSAALAQKWATENEDVAVTTGKYSAYHWAAKAEASANAAASFDPDSYFTKTEINTTLGGYVTDLELSNALSSYTTTSGLGSAAFAATSAFATASQGTKADSALQSTAIGVTVQAYDSSTAKLNADQSWTGAQRFGSPKVLTSAATISLLLAEGNDYTIVLDQNATMANPSDIASFVGQKGTIAGQQDATGGRTLSYANLWFPIGGATAPALPTAASDKFRIDYHVVSASRIDFTVSKVGV